MLVDRGICGVGFWRPVTGRRGGVNEMVEGVVLLGGGRSRGSVIGLGIRIISDGVRTPIFSIYNSILIPILLSSGDKIYNFFNKMDKNN
jgi:hypothetical protein